MSSLRKPLALSFLLCAVIALLFWRLNVYTAQQRQEQLNKAMIDAVMMQNVSVVRDLLQRGADPNCVQQPATWKEGFEDRFNESVVHRFDPSYSLSLHTAPLVLAALNPNTDVVRALLAVGARVNQKDNFGETALDVDSNGEDEIAALLKEADARQQTKAHFAESH